jgi:hypothetical protein
MGIVLLLCTGCTEFDLRKSIPWGGGFDGQFEKPMSLSAIWTDSVLQSPNRPSTRGFGGRLMFYGKTDLSAIKVEGTLIVYAFDETNRDPNNVVPDRKFVFPAEQFAKHYSKCDLGHSYSVWIPWDVAGGERREISLICRFVPKDGSGAIVSEQTHHNLPGKPRAEIDDPTYTAKHEGESDKSVQPVNYETPIDTRLQTGVNEMSPSRKMETATINLPSHFGQRSPQAFNQPALGVRADVTNGAGQLNNGAGWNQGAALNLNTKSQGMTSLGSTNIAATGATSGQSPGTSQPRQGWPVDSRSSYFGPSKPRALGAPIAQLERDRAPWRQPPPEPKSFPQSSLSAALPSDPASTSSNGPSERR